MSGAMMYNFSGIEGAASASFDGSKGGNVEFEWKVEEGESSGDVFDFTAPEAGEVDNQVGQAGSGMQQTEQGVTGMFACTDAGGDVFDFKAPDAPEAPGVARAAWLWRIKAVLRN